jgi:hypothetical protein
VEEDGSSSFDEEEPIVVDDKHARCREGSFVMAP